MKLLTPLVKCVRIVTFAVSTFSMLTLLIAAMLTFAIQPKPLAAQTATGGLVGHWAFAEGSGTTAADSSGQGGTGTLTNGPTWAPGQVGGGLAFDGANDTVEIPNSPALDVSGTQFTVALWTTMAPGGSVDYVLVGKPWTDGVGGTPHYQYAVEFDVNGARTFDFYFGEASGTLRGPFQLAPSTPYDTWHHVAYTYDGSRVRGYLNGVERISVAETAALVARGQGLRFGADARRQQLFKGTLDEVRLYNRALSAAEVAALAGQTAPAPGPAPTCTPSWTCTAWSACSSAGTQTRVCTDTNACGVTTGKPPESQSCTAPSPPPPAASNALANLAQSMGPGEWRELVTNNINPTLDANGASGYVFGYTESIKWDPISRKLFFLGGDHNDNQHFVVFDSTTNTWSRQDSGAPLLGPTHHGNDHMAVDPIRGYFYSRHGYTGDYLDRYNTATQSWSPSPNNNAPLPSDYLGCCGGIDYFPELDSVIWFQNGAVYLYRESTNSWTRVSGSFPAGNYNHFLEYNPVRKVAIFGGGNGDRRMYKANGSGQVSALSNSPINLGLQDSIVTADPVGGDYLILTRDRNFWRYDVTADSWQPLSAANIPARVWPDSGVHGMVGGPIATYGVNVFVSCLGQGSAYNSAIQPDCKVYLYKHSQGYTGNCTTSQDIDNLPAGTWCRVPNSHLYDVRPSGWTANVMNPWSGGAYDTVRDRLIVWGGGHGDYAGNEIYVFDMSQLRWLRLTDPSNPPGNDVPYAQDGNPTSRHTYEYIDYLPSVDLFCSFGGAGFYSSGQTGTGNIDCFNFSSNQWVRKTGRILTGGSIGSLSAYDPVTGYEWVHTTGNAGEAGLQRYDSVGDTMTSAVICNSPSAICSDGWFAYSYTAAVDPVLRKLVIMGNGNSHPSGTFLWDLNNPSSNPGAKLITSGATSIESSRSPGFDYDSAIGLLVAWDGGENVYTLNITSGVWRIMTPLSGNLITPTARTLNGIFGRFKYVPSKNVFVVVNSINEDVYIYRLSSGGGVPSDTTTPSAITNLAVSSCSQSSCDLTWTAPGDDGNTGTASSYDVRYATAPITTANWASATQVSGEPSPLVAGSNQNMTVAGLSTGTTYYFALRASDEAGNVGGLSNVPAGTTGSTGIAINLTVAEPAGVVRVNEPITSGIPIPFSKETARWSLWDGAAEVPVQTTILPTAPANPPWILLDFQTSLGANQNKTLVLRESAIPLAPADPVSIQEDASQITVTTGPLRAVMSKTAFNLFENVWLDRNGNRVYEAGEIVASASGNNLEIIDSTTGETWSGVGAPDNVTWEYQWPLRATLRVDGKYRTAGVYTAAKHLMYTTRITFYAGKTEVKVEQVLRNSYQPNERQVKIRSATVKIGGGEAGVRASRSGSTSWTNIASGGVSFDLIPNSFYGTTLAANGGFLIVDWSYHGATLVADFAEGLSAAEQTARTAAVKNPLFALAPATQYSEYGELTTTKFGTLEDEKNTYNQWGWTWDSSDVPQDPLAQGTGKYIPDYAVDWNDVNVHDDPESDDLWQHNLMYLRTGQRSYWDRARAWARYMKWEYAYRTDGFDYAWNGNYEHDKPVARPEISIPSTSADNAYVDDIYDPSGGERYGGRVEKYWGGDHLFGWGLADYYYLTGDKDALEAVSDLAEFSWRVMSWKTPGGNCYPAYGCIGDNGGRRHARNFLFMTRAYEVTQSLRWKNAMDFYGQLYLQAIDWDPVLGMYLYTNASGEKAMGPFHFAIHALAMERYYHHTGNATMKAKLIAMANFAKLYGIDPATDATGTYIAFRSDGSWYHSGVSFEYSSTMVDAMVRGYRLTGDASFLNRAKQQWSHANRGTYGTLVPIAPEGQVGRFANKSFTSVSGWTYYGHNKGDLSGAHLLFYDVMHPTTIAPACTPSWSCTAWSVCSSSSTRTRTCTDTNACGVVTGKPTQTQGCTYVPPASTKFSLNDRVQVIADTANLNVRSSPSLTASILGTQSFGARGTVIGGPTFANTSWWWQVNYDAGADGWSIEDYLEKVQVIQNSSLVKLATDPKVYLIENNQKRWIVDGYTFRQLGYQDSDIIVVTQAELNQFPAGSDIQILCTPNWSCTAWSACTSGIQTRTCTDGNACGVTTGKPAERQSCTVTPSAPSAPSGPGACVDRDGDQLDDYDATSCPAGPDRCIVGRTELTPFSLKTYAPTSSAMLMTYLEEATSTAYRLEGLKLSHQTAEISFRQPIDVRQLLGLDAEGCFTPLNFDRVVTVADRKVSLNAGQQPELNKPATLTFRNITFATPVIQRDGVPCAEPICRVVQYDTIAHTLVVEVNGFSTYEVVEGAPPVSSGGTPSAPSTPTSGGGGGGGSYTPPTPPTQGTVATTTPSVPTTTPPTIPVILLDSDTDGDGLTNAEEERYGTDANQPDTDGDGYGDGTEISNGHDPLNPPGVANARLAARLKGRILLQVQRRGEAWYVHPADGKRYYLRDGAAAYELMRYFSLGIRNRDLEKIPAAGTSDRGDQRLVQRLRGRILLQVESLGESWYVHPTDGKRYYLRDGAAAYELMRQFGLGITNNDIRRIPYGRRAISQ